MDISLSKGISGAVLPNPDCLPGSTYYSPFASQDLPNIKNDRSLSVLYFFPKMLSPHRSMLLPGVKKGPRVLSSSDLDAARFGTRKPNRGGWDRGRGGHNPSYSRPPPQASNPYNYDRGYGGRGDNSY